MSDDGDRINVSVQRLRETASYFQNASQNTFDVLNDLNGIARQLVNEMETELRLSPGVLARFSDRWSIATSNLGNALQEVANSLNTAAENYRDVDKNGMPLN